MKKKKQAVFRDDLISAGVRNLKEFGYGKVTAETIITDEVYSQFFLSMLEQYPTIPAAVELVKEIKGDK